MFLASAHEPDETWIASAVERAAAQCFTSSVRKVDFKKSSPTYRAKSGVFDVIEIPQTQYLMSDGAGDPSQAQAYPDAIQTLYPVAYTIKAASKKADKDYVVPPLSGLWWADDLASFTTARDRSKWLWTMMMMVPDWISRADFATAALLAKKKDLPSFEKLRLDCLTEGTCVQTLHLGPYDAEGPTIARMHEEFMPVNGLKPTGKHHEIYLSDPRRVAPEKLRTILRQPVVAV